MITPWPGNDGSLAKPVEPRGVSRANLPIACSPFTHLSSLSYLQVFGIKSSDSGRSHSSRHPL